MAVADGAAPNDGPPKLELVDFAASTPKLNVGLSAVGAGLLVAPNEKGFGSSFLLVSTEEVFTSVGTFGCTPKENPEDELEAVGADPNETPPKPEVDEVVVVPSEKDSLLPVGVVDAWFPNIKDGFASESLTDTGTDAGVADKVDAPKLNPGFDAAAPDPNENDAFFSVGSVVDTVPKEKAGCVSAATGVAGFDSLSTAGALPNENAGTVSGLEDVIVVNAALFLLGSISVSTESSGATPKLNPGVDTLPMPCCTSGGESSAFRFPPEEVEPPKVTLVLPFVAVESVELDELSPKLNDGLVEVSVTEVLAPKLNPELPMVVSLSVFKLEGGTPNENDGFAASVSSCFFS